MLYSLNLYSKCVWRWFCNTFIHTFITLLYAVYLNVSVLITRTISLDLRFAHGQSLVALRPVICTLKVVKTDFYSIKKSAFKCLTQGGLHSAISHAIIINVNNSTHTIKTKFNFSLLLHWTMYSFININIYFGSRETVPNVCLEGLLNNILKHEENNKIFVYVNTIPRPLIKSNEIVTASLRCVMCAYLEAHCKVMLPT